jgi:GTP-binding protein EngB required for normal cell division
LLGWLEERQLPALIVITKADKLNRDGINRKVKQVESAASLPVLPFSIKSGLGKRELARAVLDLVENQPKR